MAAQDGHIDNVSALLAHTRIEQTNKELEAQKQLALQKLETQIDDLSQLIKEKLLGKVSLV